MVSDEVIQKGFFSLWFKVWSHSTPQICVTGILTLQLYLSVFLSLQFLKFKFPSYWFIISS